jgi:formate dehydrogenase maturation protein FdhE
MASVVQDHLVRESWDPRIARAEQLAAGGGVAAPLLSFYARLLREQKAVYEAMSAAPRPSGTLIDDLPLIERGAAALVQAVAEHGPPPLAAEAEKLQSTSSGIEGELVAHWSTPSDRRFFAKAILQPYAQRLVDDGITPADRRLIVAENRCPKCGGMPQLSILESSSTISGDGSGRQLLCALCLTAWPFRRIVCPSCGEDDEMKIGYFESREFDYQRVEACETCRRYLKAVDLGRLGLAVPLVDEIAGAPLDLWAREHGYEKIELNLVGL